MPNKQSLKKIHCSDLVESQYPMLVFRFHSGNEAVGGTSKA